ncbi:MULTISPECIES: SAM-dependent methyltransferase [unclassified Streptomyces]|uniref:SAM-dependent methyltransferase n=1 Tax=unclassified Streptomyces TaxID=2593676 RepID=UPI00363B3EEB
MFSNDIDRPTSARIHNWLLGDSTNYAPDRVAGTALTRMIPNAPELARASRAYVIAEVERQATAGCGQFLDLGCGLPHTALNVHEAARARNRNARTVYVDHDRQVLAFARTVLEEDPSERAVEHDLTRPGILSHPDVTAHLTLDEPVTVLAAGVLEHLPDDAVTALLRELGGLPDGSRLVACSLTCDSKAVAARTNTVMAKAAHGVWGRMRTTRELAALLPMTDELPLSRDSETAYLAADSMPLP